jgi:hypothetical protein
MNLTDEEKQQAHLASYKVLVHHEAGASVVDLLQDLTQQQIDILKRYSFRAAYPGIEGTKMRTLARHLMFAHAAYILRARYHQRHGKYPSWVKIQKDTSRQYTGDDSKRHSVRNARQQYALVFESMDPAALAASPLPHIDLSPA